MSKVKLYCAPLQSYTTVYYRFAHHMVFGGISKYFTPFFEEGKENSFIPSLLPELNSNLNRDFYVVPQVLTRNPSFLIHFARTVGEMGYKEINLNMGCPHPPVVRKGLGGGLLKDPNALMELLEFFFMECPEIKLSIKMRTGLDDHMDIEKLAPVLNRFPLHEIILHPRTVSQQYKGVPDWDALKKGLSILELPVVANGDIFTRPEYQSLQARFPQVERWMIGRGLMRRPWLAQDLTSLSSDSHLKQVIEFHTVYTEWVDRYVLDINVKRNLLLAFWFYLSESLENGHRLFRNLKKQKLPANYPRWFKEVRDELKIATEI